MLKLPHRRPSKLSDPYGDFSSEYLVAILAKPDAEFGWHDYQSLLGPYLPAGTYEESVYFLPLAFDHILTHEDGDIDLVPALVGFCSRNAANLDRDNALVAVREKLQECLVHWTAEFTIDRYEREVWRNGRLEHSFDLIRHSETVITVVREMVLFETHAELAVAFFADLAAAESNAVKSAWFLEMARAHRTKSETGPPTYPAIKQLLDDTALIQKHAKRVWDLLPGCDADSIYWHDTLTLLRSR